LRLLALAAAALLASCASPTATETQAEARAPLLAGFGNATLAPSQANATAQQLFAQGMAQAYAFNAREAVRAFKAALAADPQCTLCAWGVAWQLGPNINDTARGDLGEARRHVRLAQRDAGRATALEQALVESLAVRYGSPRDVLADGPGGDLCGPAPGGRPGRAHPLDVAYAERLRGLADRLPDDPDIVSLYAEAEMIATPEDWWDAKTGQAGGRIGEVAARLEHALRGHEAHTGLNHYMIHAVDSSATAARAVAAADRLGALAPASPHLLHMPSHIYVKVGRFDDAVRVNQEALSAELALTATLARQNVHPVWNWDRHNLHFLWFAALMEDQGELALSTARRVAELAAGGKSPYAEYRRTLPLLTLARLERWDELLREPVPGGEQGVAAGLGAGLQGLALVQGGQVAPAREKAALLRASLDTVRSGSARATEEDATPRHMLETLDGWLQAALAMHDGRTDAARQALAAANEAEDAAGGEPPLLGAGSRLALGRVLLRAGQWAEAEAAFRDDLRLHPGNAFGLRGLAQAEAARKPVARSAPIGRSAS
jgi:tetratricopeptide (TPR) repeat protein